MPTKPAERVEATDADEPDRTGHRRHTRRWAALVVLVTAAAAAAVGISGVSDGDADADGVAPATDQPQTRPPQEWRYGRPVSLERRPARRDPAAGVPTRVVVPALSIDAPVVPISVTGGVLTPPSDPQVLGWWSSGAVPGALRGRALITGHTVHTGGGALDDLERLVPGDDVRVRTANGTVRYHVVHVRTFRKASLADHAAHVFAQDRPGRLVLITCEDWDGTKYLSNVVVVGAPQPARSGS